MKSISYTVFIFALLGFSIQHCFGQEPRVVVVSGWDPLGSETADEYNNVLFDVVEEDVDGRAQNPNTIYELKRGHLYPQGEVIQNSGYHLQIRAEEGEGFLPEFIPGKKSDGSYGNDFIRTGGDLTVANISFNAFRPDGGYLVRCVELRSEGSRAEFDGVVFYGDRGSAVMCKADKLRVYVRNVIVANTGHRKTGGGNGRLVDLRPEALEIDSLVIENTTMYNASDRILRNQGTIINNIYIDHITVLNTKGWHGGIQLGKVKNAVVKNSLFADVISMGHNELRTSEQNHESKHLAVISLEEAIDGGEIEIKNNNIFWTQAVKDVWAKYDSVEAPYFVSQEVKDAVGAENVDAIYFEEEIEFNQVCGDLSDYVDAYYMDPSADEFPENWCVGGEGGLFPDQVDVGYAPTYDSYTAGDDGFPVGNYGGDFKLVASAQNLEESTHTILDIYPNPTSNGLLFLDNSSLAITDLVVLNMAGQQVDEYAFSLPNNKAIIDLSSLGKGVFFLKTNLGSAKVFNQ